MKNIPIVSITYFSSGALHSIDFYDITELQKFLKKFKFVYNSERPLRVNLKEMCSQVYKKNKTFIFFYIYSNFVDSLNL